MYRCPHYDVCGSMLCHPILVPNPAGIRVIGRPPKLFGVASPEQVPRPSGPKKIAGPGDTLRIGAHVA